MNTLWTTVALIALLAVPTLNAQSTSGGATPGTLSTPAAPTHPASGVPLRLAPGSQLTMSGTSTLHPFTCITHDLQAFITVDSSYATVNLTTIQHPIESVRIVIPVKTLACGGKLEGNMFKTLNVKDYPTITYLLNSYDTIAATASESTFAVNTKGGLTISGKSKEIAMQVNAVRTSDGVVTATGEETMLMTDFGIKPPTFMLGMLRVGNTIVVHFVLKATAQAVTQARAALAALSPPFPAH